MEADRIAGPERNGTELMVSGVPCQRMQCDVTATVLARP